MTGELPEGAAGGGWLPWARRLPSPHQDRRPPGTRVDLVVVHGISLPPGEFGGPWVERLFLGELDPAAHPAFRELAGLRVSAHLFIRRDGELVQFVPLERRAWHAGRSAHQGREGCNDYSVGIELEGTDQLPYEAVQYRVLARVCRELMARFPGIVPERIVGHCHVAPGRKTDPGPSFDWALLRRLLAEG